MAEGDSNALDPPRELIRETVTMALYIGLSLLAVLVAVPTADESETGSGLARTVALTALGLLVAHQVAFRISTRLVSKGGLPKEDLKLLGGQIAGGLFVAVLAVLPLLLWGPSALRVTEFLLISMVAVVGYLAARSAPTGRIRSLAYVAILVLVVVAVLWIKSLAGH